jgi:hypothetical protein
MFWMQALDKIRFLSLVDNTLLGEGDVAQLDIHVSNRSIRAFLEIKSHPSLYSSILFRPGGPCKPEPI